MNRTWEGRWIWMDPGSANKDQNHELILFRRSFVVSEPLLAKLTIHVTADSRYKLYVNGERVSLGPCKGDMFAHYFETIDVSSHLRKGKNVLAAQVLHYGGGWPFRASADGNASVWRSRQGGFLLDGTLYDEAGIAALHTGDGWRCIRDESMTWADEMPYTAFLGGMERVEGAKRLQHWHQPEHDDSEWQQAQTTMLPIDKVYGQLRPWQLQPRSIPALRLEPRTFRQVVQQSPEVEFSGLTDAGARVQTRRCVNIPPGQQVIVELDAGELCTGYPYLALSCGQNSEIRLLYAECYEPDPGIGGTRMKGVRDDPNGTILMGPSDVYLPAGSGSADCPETYTPFWFRTFRFVRLTIRTEDQPLQIHAFGFVDTGYPLEIQGRFASSDDSLLPLWEISVRTLLRCMHETYEDCPFYEQLQYAMDTQLEALFTYQLSADDRLVRKAIYEFHSSRLPNGMLQSRYPCVQTQVIPGFSMYWIFMLQEHALYFGDRSFTRPFLPTMDGVLNWFEQRIGEEGLIGRCPDEYWSFVDWVPEWKAAQGVPTAARNGPLTVTNLMYIEALNRASWLYEWLGYPDMSRMYKLRSTRVAEAVRAQCWSPERKLFRDGPDTEEYSQHAQIWAVLSGTVQGAAAEHLMTTMLASPDLPKASYAMTFYLFRALSQVGKYDDTYPLWDIWRNMAKLNVTTWPERPKHERSDCHGWGALPLYEFSAEVLGVKPGLPGYKEIHVEPKPGPLKWAAGTVATVRGSVDVSWKMEEDGRFALQVKVPVGIPVQVRLPCGKVEKFMNHQGMISTKSLHRMT